MAFAEVVLPQLGNHTQLTKRVVVTQRLYKHDTLVFDVPDRSVGRLIRKDAPVRAHYGGPDAGEDQFLGYVMSTRPVTGTNTANAPMVRVHCVGASYRMKTARQRVWTGRLSDAVIQLAREYKLTPLVPRTASSVTKNQSGRSDWEFLVGVARDSGRWLYCRGLQLTFVEPTYWLEKAGRNAPALPYGRGGPGSMIVFQPRETNLGDPKHPTVARSLSGLDANGKLFTVSSDGQPRRPERNESTKVRFAKPVTGVPVRSIAEAQDRLAALDEETRWKYRARIEAVGHTRIRRGEPVYVESAPEGFVGYWMVLEATHVFEGGRYMVEAELGSDSLGTNLRPPPNRDPIRDPDADDEVPPFDGGLVLDDTGFTPEDPAPSDLSAFDDSLLEVDDGEPEVIPSDFGEDAVWAAPVIDPEVTTFITEEDDEPEWLLRRRERVGL